MIQWRPLTLVAAFAGFLPTASSASDFWYVAAGEQSTVFDFVDAASIRPQQDGKVRAWVKSVSVGAAIAKYSRSELKEEYFNCSRDQVVVLQDIAYDYDGSIKYSRQNDGSMLRDVVPGSLGEAELSFVCMNQSERATNKNWIHISVTPEVFADNAYETLQLANGPK